MQDIFSVNPEKEEIPGKQKSCFFFCRAKLTTMLLVAFLYYLPTVMKNIEFMTGHVTGFKDDIATTGVNREEELARRYSQGLFFHKL